MKPLYLAAALLATSMLAGQAMAAEHAKAEPVVEKTTSAVEPKIETGKDTGVVEDTAKPEGKVMEESKTPPASVAAEPANGTKPAH